MQEHLQKNHSLMEHKSQKKAKRSTKSMEFGLSTKQSKKSSMTTKDKNPNLSHSLNFLDEYMHNLDGVLHKMTVQTKYANRVSNCNLKNMQELEEVKSQLHRLLELKKMEQNSEIMLKNLSNELAEKLSETQNQLTMTINEVFQHKKEIKKLKKTISDLQKSNSKLEDEIISLKKTKIASVMQIYDNSEQKLLSTLIEDYIKSIKHPTSPLLHKHCIETMRTKNYTGFLPLLEKKIHIIEVENQDKLRIPKGPPIKSPSAPIPIYDKNLIFGRLNSKMSNKDSSSSEISLCKHNDGTIKQNEQNDYLHANQSDCTIEQQSHHDELTNPFNKRQFHFKRKNVEKGLRGKFRLPSVKLKTEGNEHSSVDTSSYRKQNLKQ